MALNRNISSHEGLYVSASPSSGYQFFYANADSPNNDYTVTDNNFNLVRPLPRVQAINYSINLDRTEIKQLGTRGLVALPILQYPTVNLNFSYLSAGILNEYRMGFDVNYTNIRSGASFGTPYYADNFSVCCLDSFITRELEWDSETFRNTYQDKKNYFVAVHRSGDNTNQSRTGQTPDYLNLDVYSFGDCQLSSYRAAGSIGELPVVNVGFIGSNLNVHSSGSGIEIPALEPYSRGGFPNTKIVLPSTYERNLVTALLPGDTTVNITARPAISNIYVIQGTGITGGSNTTNIPNLGINFQNLNVQSYEVSLDLNREPLISLDAKLPLDRRISFPVYVTCNLGVLFNTTVTGKLNELFRNDLDYDISLKLANPRPYSGVGLQYDFKRAKLNNFSAAGQIGNNKAANLSFITEINPDNLSRGFFMSGTLNVDSSIANAAFGALKKEDGSYLLTEAGDRILLFNSVQI